MVVANQVWNGSGFVKRQLVRFVALPMIQHEYQMQLDALRGTGAIPRNQFARTAS